MAMRYWVAALITLSPCHLVTLSGAEPASKVPVEVDIVYSKVGDKELKLDLAKPPEGKGPFPVVVCLHGGGWRMGNKREMKPWIQLLAKEGYVAASVGYRLAPDFTFPSQIEDCKTAVRFLRANAEKFGIDKDRFAAMGFSAGGHLVCLLGLTDETAGFEGKEHPKESSRVQAVVDYFGPTDFAGYAKDDTAQRGMIGPFIGAKFSENPAAHEKASPIKYVTKGAPPFLIFHGTKDLVVPIEQSRNLATKLKDVGTDVKIVEVPGEGHGWEGRANVETTKETLKFLAETLKK
jgi:acetyl esterase/lipase